MTREQFDAKCAEAIKWSSPPHNLSATKVAKKMGYSSRQAVHRFLHHDKKACRCCHQPLSETKKSKSNGKGT